MSAMASQINGISIVCSTVYLGADQRKYQSFASLSFVRGIHRWPVNSPHKWPVTRKMFPIDGVSMDSSWRFVRNRNCYHDVIKWKHFPRYWPFVRGIHRSPVNSPHKGQRRGALICAWTNGWANHQYDSDLRCHCAHYDVTVMVHIYKIPTVDGRRQKSCLHTIQMKASCCFWTSQGASQRTPCLRVSRWKCQQTGTILKYDVKKSWSIQEYRIFSRVCLTM